MSYLSGLQSLAVESIRSAGVGAGSLSNVRQFLAKARGMAFKAATMALSSVHALFTQGIRADLGARRIDSLSKQAGEVRASVLVVQDCMDRAREGANVASKQHRLGKDVLILVNRFASGRGRLTLHGIIRRLERHAPSAKLPKSFERLLPFIKAEARRKGLPFPEGGIKRVGDLAGIFPEEGKGEEASQGGKGRFDGSPPSETDIAVKRLEERFQALQG